MNKARVTVYYLSLNIHSSTGWFHEWIWAWSHKQTKQKWGSYGSLN